MPHPTGRAWSRRAVAAELGAAQLDDTYTASRTIAAAFVGSTGRRTIKRFADGVRIRKPSSRRSVDSRALARRRYSSPMPTPSARSALSSLLPGPLAPSALPDVLRFMQVLWRVVHAMERASKRMAANRGVTGPQRLVLRLVGLQPGVSAGALAAALHVHPSTLTGVLRRLQAQRLLARQPDAADRRRAVLQLTERGRRVNDIRRGTIEAAVEAALRRLSPRDRACARRALAAIADSVEV